MNAIQEVKDENLRKIAQTLRSSGLASSETEAVRMAMMMSKTSQKITQNFDQKKTHPSSPFQAQEIQTLQHHEEVIVSVHTSPSVQEKPRKTEEKEEFIFGDVQEQKPVQKKDVYKADNEFEEIVVQEVIITKEVPQATLRETVSEVPRAQPASQAKPSMSNGRPSMFGSGTMASNPPVFKPVNVDAHIQQPVHEEPYRAPRPVPQPVVRAEPRPEPIHVSQQMPTQRPASTPSSTPVTATSSAQMAFASLLGDINKTQTRHQEQKPAVQSPAQASFNSSVHAEHKAETTQSSVQSSQNAFSMLLGSAQKNPHYEEEVKHGEQEAQKVSATSVESPKEQQVKPIVQPAHVVAAHAPDPRTNMMKGVDVDLTKMFNVNK